MSFNLNDWAEKHGFQSVDTKDWSGQYWDGYFKNLSAVLVALAEEEMNKNFEKEQDEI